MDGDGWLPKDGNSLAREEGEGQCEAVAAEGQHDRECPHHESREACIAHVDAKDPIKGRYLYEKGANMRKVSLMWMPRINERERAASRGC